MFRKKLSYRKSRKLFRRTIKRVHVKNIARTGIRA